jgi:Fe-S-cluster containining protein
MKQIIQHEQCLRCRECCRFRENRQYFAPLFTESEIETIAETRADMPEFKKFQDSETVFQIQLTRSKMDDKDYPYVCPFLDEDQYTCTIYEERPFDCRLWPMIIHKIQQNGPTILAHFTGDACLALQEVSDEDFADYKEYFQKLATSPKFLQFLKKYPELIWAHEEDGDYRTIPIADIPIRDSE